MAREFFRSDRVGDAIQRYLANMIQQEIRDPRVGMVNINDVTVSRDMSFAKVYFTLIGGDEAESRASGEVLNKAAGFLRTLLAKELNMRTVPRLQFYYDHTSVRGQALSSLIDKAVAEDRSKGGDEDE
ncbi:30S ribosome-binding factor RbfA [Gilvimarinus sp. SDUM040013]|uniref:Ribosome-binding factor A n=1 Tax=Gilvimarinus gilvus TaxID=3058038 RepID=A0ABU4RTW9_9GAMM|nr:30S ribosome-binding factor RbfA [Gilvimarinus sp. SDUM040013]MDO3386735.1 30S ribosome-binding factor RbfA [Gilvimarinus sp. SDUM040013]MDX6848335.1 30S ribosome-binding factor RbfA [Gilvimarinus sp. SDUM040013]